MSGLLIYGAYGYTGQLVVEEALAQGLKPRLAGRDPRKLEEVARRSGLEAQAFALSDSAALEQALTGQQVVLHCAGPFTHTWRPMAEACLKLGVHYLDITGEIEVFEALAARDAQARAADVMFLPGVGFDVVPTDCLAAHLKARLPGATRLKLAFMGGGGFSRGTRRTMLEGLGQGGLVRRAGRIETVPAAWKTRQVDFGVGGLRTVATIPWGDVATAFYSTGIPDIETYVVLPRAQIRFLRLSRYLGWLLQSRPVQAQLRRRMDAGRAGPDAATRDRTANYIWGEARDTEGRCVESRMTCANGYAFTARSAVAASRRVLAGEVQPGFRTPSLAFGAGFAASLGATIEDIQG